MSKVIRSRAALIFLGGWGLQTMLHLEPRLNFLQRQREILGQRHGLPDIRRQTAFATVNPTLAFGLHGSDPPQPSIEVLRMSGSPGTYFAEEFSQQFSERVAGGLETRSPLHLLCEEKGLALRTKAEPFLERLPLGIGISATLAADRRPDRRAFASYALYASEPIARAIITRCVDATRLDDIQPSDTHVQTHVYMIGSLAEPLTSCLIWPVAAQLCQILGKRNTAHVTGIFSTASFSLDKERGIEEASAYAALRELEALTGTGNFDRKGSPALARVIFGRATGIVNGAGERLFDTLYLADREKQSQSLATDDVELSVMVANAIESFITADGDTHLESVRDAAQKHDRRHPYSLLGSTSHFVPLREYLDEAEHEEQSRILRETVLAGVKESASAAESNPDEAAQHERFLSDNGLRPDDLQRSLLGAGWRGTFRPPPISHRLIQEAFRRWRDDGTAQSGLARFIRRRTLFPSLHVRAQRWLTQHAGRLLAIHARASEFTDWSEVLMNASNRHVLALPNRLNNEEFHERWGLDGLDPGAGIIWRMGQAAAPRRVDRGEMRLRSDELEALLSSLRAEANARRFMRQRSVIPQRMHAWLRELTVLATQAPDGVQSALARVNFICSALEIAQIAAVGANRSALHDRIDQIRGLRQQWEQDRLPHFLGSLPFASTLAIRGALFFALWAYLTIHIFWLEPEVLMVTLPDNLLIPAQIAAMAIGALPLLSGLLERSLRVRRFLRRRVSLEQMYVDWFSSRFVGENVTRVYEVLLEPLRGIRTMLSQDLDLLQERTQPREPFVIPPEHVKPSHIRQAHVEPTCWASLREFFAEMRVDGRSSALEKFRAAWGGGVLSRADWSGAGNHPAQRWRKVLEWVFLPATRRAVDGLVAMQAESLQEPTAGAAQDEASACPMFPTGAVACNTCTLRKPPKVPVVDDCWWHAPPGAPAFRLVTSLARDATAGMAEASKRDPKLRTRLTQLIEDTQVERLVLRNLAQDANRAAHELDQLADNMLHLAKPYGLHDTLGAWSSSDVDANDGMLRHTEQVNFLVVEEKQRSRLAAAFARKSVPALSSHDPCAIFLTRTIHGLGAEDLVFVERLRDEYFRMSEPDVNGTAITTHPESRRLVYGDMPAGLVTSEFASALYADHQGVTA